MATEHSAEQQSTERDFHNILIDTLPEALTVEGRSYAINSDFRAGILFEMLVQDREMSDDEKTYAALDLFFTDEIPDNQGAAVDAILWFYQCGYQNPSEQKKTDRSGQKDSQSGERIFDYDIDAPLIYAAFKSQYKIDLQDEFLHWWKFSAMFRGLHSDEKICEVIGYRSMELSKIKDKEMRAYYAKLKAQYTLPSGMTEIEKVAMAGNVFAGGH